MNKTFEHRKTMPVASRSDSKCRGEERLPLDEDEMARLMPHRGMRTILRRILVLDPDFTITPGPGKSWDVSFSNEFSYEIQSMKSDREELWQTHTNDETWLQRNFRQKQMSIVSKKLRTILQWHQLLDDVLNGKKDAPRIPKMNYKTVSDSVIQKPPHKIRRSRCPNPKGAPFCFTAEQKKKGPTFGKKRQPRRQKTWSYSTWA